MIGRAFEAIWWSGFVGGFLWGLVTVVGVLVVVGVVRETRRRKRRR